MTDYMKEAERLLEQYENAYVAVIDMSVDQARAALLAHIQRGAVPEGYVAVPRFLAENHRNLTDVPRYQRILDDCLAAAPDHFRDAAAMAPDQFRDATKMMADPAEVPMPQVRWATCPETDTPCSHCPTKRIACQAMTAPAEVPMPEEDGWFCWASGERGHSPFFSGYEPLAHSERERAFTLTKLLTYGAACRAAGEAAGYARGLKEAGRDVERLDWILDRVGVDHRGVFMTVGNAGKPNKGASVEAIDAALRVEVKP